MNSFKEMTDRVFVGHLPQSMGPQEFEDMMNAYGAIVKADLKLGYGFVTFADPSSADAAINGLHNKEVDGNRIVCEPSKSSGPYPSGVGGRPERRDQYRIVVEGIDESVTWTDLKDFARDQGAMATYADVRRIDGACIGTLAFPTVDAMNRALSDLNGKSVKGCTLTLRESTEPLPPAPRRFDNRDGGFRGGDRFDDRRRDDGPRGGYDRYDDRRRDDGPRGGDRFDDRRRDDGPRGGDRFDDRRRDDGPRGAGYDRYDDRGFDRRDDRDFRDSRGGGYDRRDDRGGYDSRGGFDRRDDRVGAFNDRRDDRGYDRRDERGGYGGGGAGYPADRDRNYPPRRDSPPRSGGGYRDGPRGGDFGGYPTDRRGGGDYPSDRRGGPPPAAGPRGGGYGGPGGDRGGGYPDRR